MERQLLYTSLEFLLNYLQYEVTKSNRIFPKFVYGSFRSLSLFKCQMLRRSFYPLYPLSRTDSFAQRRKRVVEKKRKIDTQTDRERVREETKKNSLNLLQQQQNAPYSFKCSFSLFLLLFIQILLPQLLQRKTASSNLILFPILSLHLF